MFLSPAEVDTAVAATLPACAEQVQARLAEVRGQLVGLEAAKRSIDARARRRMRVVTWGGLGMMTAQWTLLFRLAYFELSWDVVEPIGFFLGGLYSIAGYVW